MAKKKKAQKEVEIEDAQYVGLTVAPEEVPAFHGDIVRPDIEKWVADDLVDFFKKKEKGYEDVPDFMIRDVYKSYFNPDEDMQFECKEHMFWWHSMLMNTSNYLLHTVTQNKPGYSFIATKHIVKMLQKEIEKNQDLKDHLQNGSGEGQGEGQGQGGGNGSGNGQGQPDFDQINKDIQDKMDETIKDASNEIDKKKEAEEAMGGGNLAGKGPSEIELLEERIEILKDVILNKNEVGKLIKQSIKGFKAGFGSKSIITEESLFEADQVEDLIDEHYLFSELLAMDVNVRDMRQQMTAFDLYIDVSGSMSSSLSVYGKSVKRLNMAISLACRMQAMGCLGDTYAFNDGIWKIKEDQIWHLSPSGGTNIEKCMRNIKKLKRPSVILTDGEDGFSTYTECAFIMSISPGGGHYYRNNTEVQKMVRNRKYIEYNGKNLSIPKI